MKPQAEGLKILETRFLMNVKLHKKGNILVGAKEYGGRKVRSRAK